MPGGFFVWNGGVVSYYAAASAIGRGISPPFILKAQTLRPASRMMSDTISIVVSSFTESILITFLNLLEVFYLIALSNERGADGAAGRELI